MRETDKVYLGILAFQTFVSSKPFFLSAYDMLVTYVFDSIIFGTFILHLNSCSKESWELSEKKNRTIL